MTQISYEALEGKTIGEILQLADQAKNLPEGFKIVYSKPKVQTAEELLKELNQEVKTNGAKNIENRSTDL